MVALCLAQILCLKVMREVEWRLRRAPVLIHTLGLSGLRRCGQVVAEYVIFQLGARGMGHGHPRLQVVGVLGVMLHYDGIFNLTDQGLVAHISLPVHGPRFRHNQAAGRRLVQVGLLWFEKGVLRMAHGVAIHV